MSKGITECCVLCPVGYFNPHKHVIHAIGKSLTQIPITSFQLEFPTLKLISCQIGELPKGLNPPSSNMLYFSGPYLALAIKTELVTGILSLTEGIAVGRTFVSLKNYQVDGNKEMMAIGLLNIAGSCSSCYVTTGSFSRSAVNYNAGAQTVVSNIIMASAVLVTFLFLLPLFYYTLNVVLAAIVITAGGNISLQDPASCLLAKHTGFGEQTRDANIPKPKSI